jgi:hypothetical protein
MPTKRLTLVALPFLLVAGIAAGCGGSSKPSSAASNADATSAATGDIPDNQTFLTFVDRRAGFSIRYPEGWARKATHDGVTFKDNFVQVHVSNGPARVTGKRQVKTTYTTQSAPNPVTGKRLKLTVDHYELARPGRRAVVELSTPVGVDNVDAYRLMIQSFKWL